LILDFRFSIAGQSDSKMKNHQKRPRQESNLVRDLRKVACIHHTPRTDWIFEFRFLILDRNQIENRK
jgi:hypothetical protein